ncbi:hypothetical protein F444_02166 [Phytophthora nicotianae P1976]|uniref:Uncharacterized protein n=1 Tax=Phytophthora nicotianae P1976 TaxID=1317066 RepID=A0A081AYB2_PHYNI|nr:hypothetical protein F444_02166 [Phytophthora nicotianae P1976]
MEKLVPYSAFAWSYHRTRAPALGLAPTARKTCLLVRFLLCMMKKRAVRSRALRRSTTRSSLNFRSTSSVNCAVTNWSRPSCYPHVKVSTALWVTCESCNCLKLLCVSSW